MNNRSRLFSFLGKVLPPVRVVFCFEKGDVDVLFEFWKSIYNFSLDFSLQCFLNFIYSKQFVFPYLVKRDKYEKIIAKILKL